MASASGAGRSRAKWCVALAATLWCTTPGMAAQSSSANFSATPGLFASGGAQGSSANYLFTGALAGLWFADPSSKSAGYQSGNVVNGACVSGQILSTAPANPNLCVAGTASAVASGTTAYTWACLGSNGGTAANCSAVRNYAITTSVSGGNGTISASQNVAWNATPGFTLTPGTGYMAGWVDGTCGGTLTGNSFISQAVVANCTVVAHFAPAPAAGTSYTAPSATGAGNITAAFSGAGAGCSYTMAQFANAVPPAGVKLIHGVFNFATNDCGAGATLDFTITYPQALPPGTRYYKYGPEFGGGQTPHWYVLPATISGKQIHFRIRDNGEGDSNPAAGFIADPGGPGVPDDGSEVVSVPALSAWTLLALAGLMALSGVRTRTRRCK